MWVSATWVMRTPALGGQGGDPVDIALRIDDQGHLPVMRQVAAVAEGRRLDGEHFDHGRIPPVPGHRARRPQVRSNVRSFVQDLKARRPGPQGPAPGNHAAERLVPSVASGRQLACARRARQEVACLDRPPAAGARCRGRWTAAARCRCGHNFAPTSAGGWPPANSARSSPASWRSSPNTRSAGTRSALPCGNFGPTASWCPSAAAARGSPGQPAITQPLGALYSLFASVESAGLRQTSMVRPWIPAPIR